MNVDEYSKHKQFYGSDIPGLLPKLLKEVEWKTCLDLGCGDGALLSALHTEGHIEGKIVYAVDLSSTRLNLVKEISTNINCILADASETQLKDGSIDLLISTQV